MYRSIFLLLPALCIFVHIQAQNPLPTENALNAAGNTLVGSGGKTYAYSVGELAGFSLSGSCSFTQGVIQPRYTKTIVAIAEPFDEKYRVVFYPNPANDQIIVETDFTGFTHFMISGADGRLLEHGSFNYVPISLDKFPAGAYCLQLLSADTKTVKTAKIIKQ